MSQTAGTLATPAQSQQVAILWLLWLPQPWAPLGYTSRRLARYRKVLESPMAPKTLWRQNVILPPMNLYY